MKHNQEKGVTDFPFHDDTFCITDPLRIAYGFPSQRDSDEKFQFCMPAAVEPTVDRPVIWGAVKLIWRHSNAATFPIFKCKSRNADPNVDRMPSLSWPLLLAGGRQSREGQQKARACYIG